MGKKEKLIKKLKSNPKDFTFDEAESLLGYLSYQRNNKGKTSGSRLLPQNGQTTEQSADNSIELNKVNMTDQQHHTNQPAVVKLETKLF